MYLRYTKQSNVIHVITLAFQMRQKNHACRSFFSDCSGIHNFAQYNFKIAQFSFVLDFLENFLYSVLRIYYEYDKNVYPITFAKLFIAIKVCYNLMKPISFKHVCMYVCIFLPS